MWTNSEKNFLILSNMNIKNTEKLEKHFDAEYFLKLIDFHKTGGIIYNNNEKLHCLSDNLNENVKGHYLKNLYKNSIYLEFYEKIKEDFSAIIPLKGIYFLQNIYKENPGIRYMSDIDILLKDSNITEFIGYLKEQYNFIKPNIKEINKFQKFRSHIRVYGEYKKIPIELEIHWRPFEIDIPLTNDDIKDPFLISTIHTIFHYYIWRLYHFSEWCYLYEYYYEDERLKELGFLKNIEFLKLLKKRFDHLEIFPYPYNKIIRKMNTLTSFQRFYFWYFIEKKIKTDPKYLINFIKRESLW